MSKDMKVIYENYRKGSLLKEDVENPKTWGELSQKIALTIAAEKYPRVGKSLLKFGFKLATGALKQTMDAVENLEDVLDFIPDNIQVGLEKGSEKAIKGLMDFAKKNSGPLGAFVVDDLIGMDDSLTKNLAGFSALNIDDEYEKLVDKNILKKWARGIIMGAKNVDPDEPLPDLNSKLEKDLHRATGAHPDTDEGDVRS
jgi:hypothetical protein